MKLILLSAAEVEIAESAEFYLSESLQAATGFLKEIDEALDAISEAPERCPIVEDEVRVKHLQRFPFSIFYRVDGSQLVIMTVAHNARRPGYWKDR